MPRVSFKEDFSVRCDSFRNGYFRFNSMKKAFWFACRRLRNAVAYMDIVKGMLVMRLCLIFC